MRLLTIIAELGVGGAEVVAVTLATAAAAERHDVTLASGPGFRIPQVRAAGVRHLPVPLVGRSPVDLARALARVRSAGRPDVVHAHNPKATVVARLALGRRVPILTTLHGIAEAERGAAARILRRASDRVAVVSPHIAEQLERGGYPADRIDFVPNAVSRPAAYSRAIARSELGIPTDAVVGLCLARMVPQKRHDLLIEAWSQLGDRALLLLAGDGPNRAHVATAIDRHRVGETVRQLGERADVPRLMAASDFLVLPTDWEGSPISVLEAMAAGVPVVASRVGGLAEQFAGAARLVEPGSARALAEGMDEVVRSATLRAELASRGSAAAAERSAAAMVARYGELYERLAESPYQPLTRTGGRR